MNDKIGFLNKAKIIQFIFYLYSLCIIFILKAIPGINDDYFSKIIVCVLSLYIGKDVYDAFIYYKKNRIRKHIWIVAAIVCLLIAFSLVGNDYFYSIDMGYFETSSDNILKFFLICIYSLVLCFTICYWIVNAKLKSNNTEKNIQNNIFIIFLTSGLIYLIAYNPANMFPDTYSQLRQVFGNDQLFDWHPVFHTLILKFFITFFKTPSAFAFFHIILFSYVMTKWMVKLYSKGLNAKIIYTFSCSFYINIAYGLLITNIWKDNLYNICLIWCTYLIFEMIDNFERFNQSKVNYFSLFFSVMGIFCCRHNGIIPVISIIIFIAIFLIKHKTNKKILLLSILFIVTIFSKKPLYKMINVLPNDPGVMYTPLVHDIAAIVVYNDGSTLSSNVMDEMVSILSVDQWKQQYNSTDSDSYTFYYNEFMENLNKKSTKEMVVTYLNALKDEPIRIISARLMSSQIMWNTFKRLGSSDYLYEKINTPGIEDEFGYIRKTNILTELFNCVYDFFEDSTVLNTLFFRTGIWFCILLFSILGVIIYNKNVKLLLLLIPIISNMISLAISMTCQHLRYVWALYIVSLLFLFVVIVDTTFVGEKNG